MNLGMSLFLIRASKFSTTGITREGLFSGMRTNMSGEMIRSGEASHANSALKWFLAGVDANVSGELIRATETSVTTFNGTCIGSFVNWRFTWAVRVSTRFYWNETKGTSLLREFRQDLYPDRKKNKCGIL